MERSSASADSAETAVIDAIRRTRANAGPIATATGFAERTDRTGIVAGRRPILAMRMPIGTGRRQPSSLPTSIVDIQKEQSGMPEHDPLLEVMAKFGIRDNQGDDRDVSFVGNSKQIRVSTNYVIQYSTPPAVRQFLREGTFASIELDREAAFDLFMKFEYHFKPVYYYEFFPETHICTAHYHNSSLYRTKWAIDRRELSEAHEIMQKRGRGMYDILMMPYHMMDHMFVSSDKALLEMIVNLVNYLGSSRPIHLYLYYDSSVRQIPMYFNLKALRDIRHIITTMHTPIIIMDGRPGIGKTVLGPILAKLLNARFVAEPSFPFFSNMQDANFRCRLIEEIRYWQLENNTCEKMLILERYTFTIPFLDSPNRPDHEAIQSFDMSKAWDNLKRFHVMIILLLDHPNNLKPSLKAKGEIGQGTGNKLVGAGGCRETLDTYSRREYCANVESNAFTFVNEHFQRLRSYNLYCIH
jgi:hypothetical protein